MKKNNTLIYRFLAEKLIKNSAQRKGVRLIELGKARMVIAYMRIPKHKQVAILKEMEALGIIKFKDKRNIIL